MDADIISGTASAGTIGMPVGAPFGLKLLIPTHTVFDLTSKYVEVRLRQEGGKGPILFTATTDGSYGSITDAGTTDQYVEFNIPTATVSEHDSVTTLKSLAKAGRKYDFAVDIKTSSASDTALRVQGELHWIVAEGEYSTSATTGSSLTVNVSSGSASVTLSVAAAGAQGPQGEKGDKGDTGDSGSGTVSSVAISGSDGIEVDSGSPITTTGTIALGVDAAALRSHINVEDGADVTDTTNVTAAGALMDSEVTNLAAVKAFDPTDYATAAQGATADTAIQPADISGLTGGTTGQIATKASATDYDLTWADDLTVPGLLTADHIHGNIAGTLYIHVKNTSGGTLAKGTPVYVTGHVGSSDRVEVAAADQSDPAKMPAIALLAEELADNGEGDGVIVGEIRTFDTDSPGYALNDELFVGTGALTDTKPTTGAVQPVATVGRLQASTGVLVINCQGQRSPDETFATAAQGSLADSALQSADIDTLAELNAIVTDATLIDTTDSRLSDARTPTSHSHTLSDITDAGTAAASDTGDFEASGAVSTHAAITSGVHGISTFGASLIDDADAATARTTLGVDAAGTDNSTDVTLAGSLDYLSLSGQEITLGSIDLTTDVTGTLPAANGGTGVTALTSLNLNTLGSGAATDGYVATADGAGGVAWESTPTEIGIACSDETTDLAAATGVATFRMPYAMTLTGIRASVTTAPVGSTIIVDVNESGSTILSTKLSIDASEKTSETAATAAVISDSALADDAEITVDIDQVGSTTAGAGLKIWLIGTRA